MFHKLVILISAAAVAVVTVVAASVLAKALIESAFVLVNSSGGVAVGWQGCL